MIEPTHTPTERAVSAEADAVAHPFPALDRLIAAAYAVRLATAPPKAPSRRSAKPDWSQATS